MQRALLLVSTLTCAALGWFLGSEDRSPTAKVVDRSGSESRSGVANRAGEQRSDGGIDVHDVFTRIHAEFSLQHQDQERVVRLFEELSDLKDDEFVQAIANLSSEKGWNAGEAARLLVGYWAERDLAAARGWVLGLDEKVGGNFCGAVFGTWSQSDLAGMFDWLENHPEELRTKTHRDSAGFELAKAAWRLDPERGIRLVRRLEPDGGHLWNLYHEWADHDAQAAAARILQEPDAKIRDNGIFAITSAWAPRDALAAKAWAETIPDSLLAQRTVVQIGSTVGWRDPPAGAQYLAEIPQTNDTRKALKETVENWAERDSEAALKWAAALADVSLGDWIAGAITANVREDRRAQTEKRWSELRSHPPVKNVGR